MGKPPPDLRFARVRSQEVRASAAEKVRREAWHALINIAIMHEPQTLQGYADRLNEMSVPTSRKGTWTPQLVQRVLAAKGLSAKELTRRVSQPSVYEERSDWSDEVYKAFRQRVEQLDTPSDFTGRWLPAIQHPPAVSDFVRHPEHARGKLPYGQIVQVKSAAVFICRFVADDFATFDRECIAAELEVFRFNLSREQRIARTQELREWFFRRASLSGTE